MDREERGKEEEKEKGIGEKESLNAGYHHTYAGHAPALL